MQKSKKSVYIIIVSFLILFTFLGVGLTLNPRDVPSPLINKPAPNFVMPNLLKPGDNFSKQDLIGAVSLVNVWATWCPSCRVEHDVLLKIAKTKKVKIYGIDWKDDPKKAKKWLRELGNPYQKTGSDEQGYQAIDFGVYGAPETYLIGKMGVIIYKHTGPLTWQDWQDTILPKVTKAANQTDDFKENSG